jgi:predicted transcriptional regulator
MSATSLKLPDGLKRRIARLAGAANKTAHAFMVEALSQEADRAEIRERFAKDAAISETGNHGKRQGCSVGGRI